MTAQQSRRRPRRRGLLLAAALAGAAGLGLATGSRSAPDVGTWRSAAGLDAYLDAYDTVFAELPHPAATADVRTDFGVVRVYRFDGTGESRHPLMLLPGTASGVPVWAANLPSLLEIGDVYALDLLGEPGRSIQDRPITDSADKAAWLDQTLSALPAEKFHLLGLSIGGWTATNLALHHDKHLAGLITLDPVLTFGDIPTETVMRSLPAAAPWLPRSWRDSFTSFTAGGADVEDVPVARMIDAGMAHYRMVLPQPERITPAQLGELTVPVLAILAGNSVMHDPAAALRTARTALPDGRVEVFPDASHALNGEYPEEISALVQEFVTDVEAG